MREQLEPMTKEQFEELKQRAEEAGYSVINKWRKGTKVLKLGDIILSESE